MRIPSVLRKKDFHEFNDLLHRALGHLEDFNRGPWWLRCVEFHFGKGPYAPGDHFGWHLHKEIQFEVPLSGEFEFSVKKFRTVRVKPGESLVLPPDAVHRWKCTRTGVMLGISLAVVPHAESVVLPLETRLNPSVVRSPFLQSLLGVFLQEFQYHPVLQGFAVKRLTSWIYLVVSEILELCLPLPSLSDGNMEDAVHVSRQQRVVSKIIRYIDANIGGDLSMGGFQIATGLGSRQIHRLFREVTGLSCHQYIMKRRLEIARTKLIGNPGDSIKMVAYACGFASPAHFSTKFKAIFGVSPNEVR